jgi:EmrB/QacA subfamily drug resistance transporter
LTDERTSELDAAISIGVAQLSKVELIDTTPPRTVTPRLVLLLASLSALLSSLDSSVNIAFPAIATAFSLDVPSMQWIVISYVLTYASLLLGCGRLADLWGHQRMLTWGLSLSAIAFVLCGVAPSFPFFLAARVLQGVGVAFVLAAAPALVTLTAPAETRGQALGIFQMSAAVGFALGPVIGGVLVEAFGWRAVYLFRVLPAILLALIAFSRTPLPPTHTKRQSFDVLGALTLAVGIAGVLLAISRGRDLGWFSPLVLTLLLGASTCLAAFIIVELRTRAPVVDLHLFRRLPFTVANLLNILANCSMFAIWLLVPYYIVNTLGYTAQSGGLLLTTCPAATALIAPLAGKLSDRFGTARLSSFGLGVEALGLWSIAQLHSNSPTLIVILALSLVGVGLGLFQAPNMSFVMGAIPREQQGVAGSMTQMMRTLGVVLGVTGASMLFASRRAVHAELLHLPRIDDPLSFVPAFQDVFLFAALVCAIAWGLSVLRLKSPQIVTIT